MNTFAKDLMKASAVSLAGGVASIVGLFGGLFIVGAIIDRKTKKKD